MLPVLDKPTFFFIGVSTGASSIMRVFPKWSKYLGLGDVEMMGMDFEIHDEPNRYREAVAYIKHNPLALGALITTHKMDVLASAEDLFDQLDEHATLMREISSISKREGKLMGHAIDPINSGRALKAFLPAGHWKDNGADAMIMGAGGAGLALSWQLAQPAGGKDRPRSIIVSDVDNQRLVFMKSVHRLCAFDIPVNYLLIGPKDNLNNWLLGELPARSLVVNATGLGKDIPGSPLDTGARFPYEGYIWDLNYRGDLTFLEQARSQRALGDLVIEDGWKYFIYGWLSVISEVFNVDIPLEGKVFDDLSDLAATVR